MNIKEDLAIDDLELDKEFREHPSLLFYYSDMLNDEKAKLNDMDLQLSVLTAQTATSIRKGEYEPAGDVKITENYVKELLESDKDLVDLKRKILTQKDYVGKLSATVEAFQHRKYSLIKLADLWISNYHSEVRPTERKTSRDVKEHQIRGML